MNERIQGLAKQSAEYAIEFAAKDQELYLPKFVERFAELIVAECIEQCWSVSELEHKGYVISECSKRMRKHFGVK